MKATIKKIKVYQSGNASNYEVYLPAQSSVTGKYIRKRFKRKTDALAYADQLNIKAAARNIGPLQNEIHLIAARYQDKLTPAQFEAALEAKLEESKMSNITLKELGEDFISEQESLMELGAVGKLYVKDIKVHVPKLVEWLRNPEVRSLTIKQVEIFVKARSKARNKSGKLASPRTVKNYMNTLSAILNYGIKREILTRNVSHNVKLPKYKAPVHICKPEELEKLLAHSCNHLQAWIMFGAFGGLRSSEIHQMKWEDVRLDEDQFYIGGTKNENAERFVQLTAPLKAYCKDMLEGDKPARGLVFPYCQSKKIRKMEKLYKAAGVGIKKNALRHSYGSHHLVAFQNPEITATEMGHCSPTQTFTAYRKAVLKSQAGSYWAIEAEAKPWSEPCDERSTRAEVADVIPAEKILAA
jgi:integrase